MSSVRVTAAVAEYRAAAAGLLERSFEEFTHLELLELLTDLESVSWQLPTVGHRVIARLQREASPVELGEKSLKAVLTQRLRISGNDAARRLSEAKDLGPRVSFTGESLAPLLAETAAAQESGTVGPEHVAVIRGFLEGLPGWVDPELRELSERTLVRIGSTSGPDDLRKDAAKLATAIDQDGPEPDDAERARKRSLVIGPQQADGMSRISGWLNPEARAT